MQSEHKTTNDAAEIAERLRPVDRRALKWLSADWRNPLASDDLDADADEALSMLESFGLCQWADGAYAVALSPLGARVKGLLP